MKVISRRDFAKFMGGSAALLPSLLSLSSCTIDQVPLKGISPSSEDLLLLVDGLNYEVLIKWGEKINKSETFGFNNDYTALVKLSNDNYLMWVNHEYFSSQFVSNYSREDGAKSRKQIDLEMDSVGGSIIEIENINNKWSFVKKSKYNKRITAKTEIPFAGGIEIAGSKTAIGTFAGCAGGYTPWGTVLSCEENYQHFVGEIYHDGRKEKDKHQWLSFYDYHPHHYGWVVEVNPKSGKAKKLTSIGRFSHECCTVTKAKDGTIIAYSGDDKAGEFIYKFISLEKDSLEKGELFVADLQNGKWLSLDITKSKILKETFKNQLEIQIHTRKAARLVGATPCDRPEDIEIHPFSGDIYIALTNNYKRHDLSNPNNNFHGKILKITNKNGDHLSDELSSEDFVLGGEDSKISCPDNLVFDKLGNLWITTDMAGDKMNKVPFRNFKNNGLFYIALSGTNKGKVIQVGSAPCDAELTGVTFSSDYKTLFMSVQHPGEKSKSLNDLTSHWPDGGESIPRPAIVQMSGTFLDKLMS